MEQQVNFKKLREIGLISENDKKVKADLSLLGLKK
jgi:hypothetical protein